jgi:hypothetical protein
MPKYLLGSVVTVLFSLLLAAAPAFAVTLDTIGSSATSSGNPGSDWYYTADNPTFSGTTIASSTVNITIDATQYSTTANSSGNWTYLPTTLTTGDHSVTIADSQNSLSFTIHIGQSAPTGTSSGSISTSSGTLPVAGSLTQTLLMLTGGAVILAAGLKLRSLVS